jgi:predicted ABC-type ATPase
MGRPVLLVLAGVNGAGKSSIGGNIMLRRAGLAWFNLDTYTPILVQGDWSADEANGRAWQHGAGLIDQAVAAGTSHAFETMLEGSTIARKIAAAARTHDVLVWFCGLSSPEQHIARVAVRVAAGGHDVPEAKMRERWVSAPLNLIDLMPSLSELRVFDNSAVLSLLPAWRPTGPAGDSWFVTCPFPPGLAKRVPLVNCYTWLTN